MATMVVPKSVWVGDDYETNSQPHILLLLVLPAEPFHRVQTWATIVVYTVKSASSHWMWLDVSLVQCVIGRIFIEISSLA